MGRAVWWASLAILVGALALGACAAPSDPQAIVEATTAYVRETSAVQQMRVEVEKVDGDFARARAFPTDVETDPAYVFLKREGGQWKGLILGTAFGPEDYAQYGIPASLQLGP
jgi:hypothetical protein